MCWGCSLGLCFGCVMRWPSLNLCSWLKTHQVAEVMSSHLGAGSSVVYESFFGKAFEQAADKTGSKAELEFFDTNII